MVPYNTFAPNIFFCVYVFLVPVTDCVARCVRYSLKAPDGFSRARQQAVRLSASLRDKLEGARSRGGRRRLSEATSVSAAAGPAQVLHLSSGAQTGLTVISALEGVVAEEGEV